MTAEPEDLSYIVVLDVASGRPLTYRREDAYAHAEDQPERNWRLRSELGPNMDGSDRTWAEIVELGPVAYVGALTDRRERITGTPWAEL